MLKVKINRPLTQFLFENFLKRGPGFGCFMNEVRTCPVIIRSIEINTCILACGLIRDFSGRKSLVSPGEGGLGLYSCFGKILWVDVGSGAISVERVPEQVYRQVLGGYGLGLKVLLEKQPAEVEPLGPENILGFVPGLLTGTSIHFSGRYMVVGKSPLTGGWGDSNSGGTFGPEIKRCGFDGIFITGKASKPVYLYVSDDDVQIRDAAGLWGLDTLATEEKLRAQLGDECRIASIGPAGEKPSLIAGIINDGGRAAARSGLGAVMGSKQLKAIAIKGSNQVPISNPQLLDQVNIALAAPVREHQNKASAYITDKITEKVLPHLVRRIPWKKVRFDSPVQLIVKSMQRHGTGAVTAISVECGDAPTKNWQGVGMVDFPWEKSTKISDKAFTAYSVKRYSCADCLLGCGAISSVRAGKYTTLETHRPEYETAAVFGSNILNDSAEAIIKFNDLCTRYGLDTISTGAVVAFALECFEAGILGAEDNHGVNLAWGDPDPALQLVKDIGLRRGLGDILADGVAKAAERFGPASSRFAMHIGGQEIPMHDPRFQPAYGASYILDATPARHTAGANQCVDKGSPPLFGNYKLPDVKKYDYKSMGAPQAFFAKQFQVLNCLGLCNFSSYLGTQPYSAMVNSATGWAVTDDELLEIGERILNMRQLFNLREGIDPLSFKLPARVAGNPPLAKGPTAGVRLDLDTVRAGYYKALNWDEFGRPDKKRCEELGINV